MELVTPRIAKKETKMRKTITAEERLAVTLHFLATGNTYSDLAFTFRMHTSATGGIVPEVCQALYHCLKSEFCNEFLYVDVGCQGRIRDGGVYCNSTFYIALENGALNLPDPVSGSDDPQWMFDHCNEPIPYVLVAEDAFPLGRHCMKPFPESNLSDRKRIFNYRLSRMRRVSQNVFGIWGNTFRVFTATMALEPEKAVVITLATVALHNMLRMESKESYPFDGLVDVESDDGNIIRGEWRSDASNLTKSL